MSLSLPPSSLRTARGYRPAWAKRLASQASLTREDDALLASLPTRRQCAGPLQAPAGSDTPTVVVSGWCARVFELSDGRRQIVSLLMPGDIFGFGRSPTAWEALPVVALTSVILVDATPISRVIRLRTPAHARLADACEQIARADQLQLLNQLTRLGQRTAYERVAHLLLELNARLQVMGLSFHDEFELPVRQPDLASTVGLSAVHLNRVLRDLRRNKLVQLRQRSIKLLDIETLSRVADFDVRSTGAALPAQAQVHPFAPSPSSSSQQ